MATPGTDDGGGEGLGSFSTGVQSVLVVGELDSLKVQLRKSIQVPAKRSSHPIYRISNS